MAYSGGVISVCIHCGERVGVGAKYCGQCGKADGRREMDENNRKILGGKYQCNGCERMEIAKKFKVAV